MKSVRIEFEKGGVFTAILLEDEAPETCKAFLERLPLTLEFTHSTTSGQAVVSLTENFTVERENQRTVGIYPGTLCFLVKNTSMHVPDEIYITYGPYFISRGLKVDYQEPVNVFGRVESNLDELYQVSSRLLMKGAEKITFSL